MVNCCQFQPVTVSAEEGKLRFWRNTGLSGMPGGSSVNVAPGIVGYELDSDVDNGSRPTGQIDLSTTSITDAKVLADFGDTYREGSATHSLTYHRAPSGALIFGAGTMHWSWGLDSNHDPDDIPPPPADPKIQQATVNLLADMGAQPGTLHPGLLAASPSTDPAAPTSVITSPTDGAQSPVGDPVTVTGTATDTGGGVVGGVEVSTDGGATWHPATGRSSWSYTFTPRSLAPITISSRATDDSLNTETPATGVHFGVLPRTCPCRLFTPPAVPTTDTMKADSPLELGVKFRSDQPGTATGVRFYKNTQNTGTHLGNLWSITGQLLASVTFSSETESGWQEATFSTPVPLAADTTYIVSYYSPTGFYSADTHYFSNSIDLDPLHAPASATDDPNGVYLDNADAFPTSTFQDANYWVDVVFADSAAPPGPEGP